MTAPQSTWRIVKTSGGFGVQQRTSGTKLTKSTIAKPGSSAQAKRGKGSESVSAR